MSEMNHCCASKLCIHQCGHRAVRFSQLTTVYTINWPTSMADKYTVNLEAKRGTTLQQASAPMDFTSACAAIKRQQQSVADDRYLSDPHARVRRVFTGSALSASKFQRSQRDWNRDQCATVAQLCMGHSPLLAGYLHRIGRRDSATCPHCNGADETAEHLVLQCPAHDQARRDIWLGGLFNMDPQRLWEFLERIGAVSRPPEWE